MKVILLENVRKVGNLGEIIDVKRGYARNYLISQKKALFASKENIKEVEKIKNELSKKDQDKKNQAKGIDEKIKNKEYIIEKLSTENRELYGSVKPTEISKILKETENVEINPSLIQPAKEIKSIGTFDVILNLHSDVQSKIKIKVIAQEENQ
ncbi:50S ribosomal protein L9 [Candidatus Pelagibacter sp.]|nr:50S ribosomal protein L9 [Candidatus Pelagibacter sp.]|tara:strand:- start:356 stop:814 length:459 start_codon:yes stop_codon:yes gene_type:complete